MSETNKKPFVLAVLDGWGYSEKTVGNPMIQANTPVMAGLMRNFPMTLVQASGLAVGITWGETGNSEVGHLNIGAGRIVQQYSALIAQSIAGKSFYSNPVLIDAFKHAKQNNSKIHILGLLTSGIAHADFSLISALLTIAQQQQHKEVYFHLFLDGRDSGLQEGLELLGRVEDEIKRCGCAKIATLIGRSLAMDRDNNWERTKIAYDLFTQAVGEKTQDYAATIKTHYQAGENDQTMSPIVNEDSGFSGIADSDSLIFFNFREDRMKQIVRAFAEPDFSSFPTVKYKNLYIATMTEYLSNLPVRTAFTRPTAPNNLSEVLSKNGMAQLHVAETEKRGHVTYFFNGLREEKYEGEEDIFFDSPEDVVKEPEMKAIQIARKVVEGIDSGNYDFIILNIANPDMVAHTGNYEATVKALETADAAIGMIKDKVLEKNGIMLVTADHGNAEGLTYKTSGEMETKHNENPVPLILVANQYQKTKNDEELGREIANVTGMLSDIAPTILELMGLPKPQEMTGVSLLPTLLQN